MTAHQITITNAIQTLGEGPPSLWNAYNWNAFKWGEGTAKIPWTFVHLVDADDISFASARYFRFTHLVALEDLTLASTVNFNVVKQISNSLSLSSDSPIQYLIDANGYYHVFPGGVTNADDRIDPSWTDGSASTTTWTRGSSGSTPWSDA